VAIVATCRPFRNLVRGRKLCLMQLHAGSTCELRSFVAMTVSKRGHTYRHRDDLDVANLAMLLWHSLFADIQSAVAASAALCGVLDFKVLHRIRAARCPTPSLHVVSGTVSQMLPGAAPTP